MIDVSFSLVDFEYMILVLIRIASFMHAAPFYGQRGVPEQTKIGLSFFLSVILCGLVPHPELDYTGVMGYAIIVLKEGITGLLIGFAASICNSIVLFAGNMIDMDIGLSMAMQFNSDLAIQMTITGSLYYYALFVLLLVSGMYTYILRAICDSFYVIPIGGAVFEWDSLVLSMTKYMTDLFVIGFRIFLPVFACIMILNCILGIMAKVAPQMNMFSVGMQLKVIVGYTIVLITVFMFSKAATMIFEEIKVLIALFIEGMYGS
ncbi:MAG: flagellar biosynthetic protein FliR [Lachnospiraceae bacterium]|nr:flagellar biosynthetic protein FliR [Lachnospiraceae bacterium]